MLDKTKFFNSSDYQYICTQILNMRNIGYICLLSFFLTACGEYNTVLKGDSTEDKFKMAKTLYDESMETGKRSKMLKALRLFEQIQPAMRGKPQNEIVSYYIANGHYHVGDYLVSGYKFERFIKSFPDTEKKEEAAYKVADSYYKASPRYSLDQEDTHKAIEKLQLYLDAYPEGDFFADANDHLSELRYKLEKKDYEIAKKLHHMEFWLPAAHALNNYIDANPGSSFNEQAYFYKFESQYIYASKSFKSLMRERLNTAQKYYDDYVQRYPNGQFLDLANQYKAAMQLLYEDLDNLEL